MLIFIPNGCWYNLNMYVVSICLAAAADSLVRSHTYKLPWNSTTLAAFLDLVTAPLLFHSSVTACPLSSSHTPSLTTLSGQCFNPGRYGERVTATVPLPGLFTCLLLSWIFPRVLPPLLHQSLQANTKHMHFPFHQTGPQTIESSFFLNH